MISRSRSIYPPVPLLLLISPSPKHLRRVRMRILPTHVCMRWRSSGRILLIDVFWRMFYRHIKVHSCIVRMLRSNIISLLAPQGLDHLNQTLTIHVASLLEEDPVNYPVHVMACGSSLLNWFCRFNWIGPYQDDLACPYASFGTGSLV